MANANAQQGLADMGLLFTLLDAYKILDKVNRFSIVSNFMSLISSRDLI